MIKKALVALVLFYSSSNHVLATVIGLNGNFKDNGQTVLENRSDGSIWEWLDLTVTNGLSFNGVESDLSDDGLLNNSVPNTGSTGASDAISTLSLLLQTGWSTVSDQSLRAMLNSFFGTSFSDTVLFQGYPTEDPLIDAFISAFGDTFRDGVEQSNGALQNDDPSGLYSLIGVTNSTSFSSGGTTYNSLVQVANAFYSDGYRDVNDAIWAGQSGFGTQETDSSIGVWLAREVTSVSSPNTVFLFFTAVAVVLMRRCRRA